MYPTSKIGGKYSDIICLSLTPTLSSPSLSSLYLYPLPSLSISLYLTPSISLYPLPSLPPSLSLSHSPSLSLPLYLLPPSPSHSLPFYLLPTSLFHSLPFYLSPSLPPSLSLISISFPLSLTPSLSILFPPSLSIPFFISLPLYVSSTMMLAVILISIYDLSGERFKETLYLSLHCSLLSILTSRLASMEY